MNDEINLAFQNTMNQIVNIIQVVTSNQFVDETGNDTFRNYHFDICEKHCEPNAEINYVKLLQYWEPTMVGNAIEAHASHHIV